MTKPCGHPDHPEDDNIGIVPLGASPQSLRGDEVKAHLDEPAWFVGKYCKLGFPTPQEGYKEYMWVHVERINEAKELEGPLHNNPLRVLTISHGDTVIFTTDEIHDVEDDS